MTYLLDANVFIQAKNLHYGLDFCPAFWNWLIEKNSTQQVYSIDKVSDEIAAGGDELTDWIQEQGHDLFLKTDSAVATQFSKLSTWSMSQGYDPAAVSLFLQVADYYLIAHALANKHIVVTHEVAANTKKRIKIPNVCAGLGIRFMSPYEMLRREKARFVLGECV
ncbi:MAG: DUF4411 family protein [Desulfobacterales bacterium]|nr:DUF4411 family protein [Desulfobacterales bacterium]